MGLALVAVACLLGDPTDEELGGHRFLVPQLQDSGFVVTSFTNHVDGVYQHARGVPIGDLGRHDINMGGLQQRIEFMLRLHRLVGLFVQGEGSLVAGLNEQTLILRTGEVQGDVRGGIIVRILRFATTGTQLSGRVSGSLLASEKFGLTSLLRAITEQPQVSAQTVLNSDINRLLQLPVHERTLRVSLHLAQAFTTVASVQVTAGVTFARHSEEPFNLQQNERVTREATGARKDVAVALALNGAAYNFPVALLGEYRFATGDTAQFDLNNAPEHTVGAGLFYSGRSDLQLGLEGSYRITGPQLIGVDENGAPAHSEPLHIYTGGLVFRYVW